jgi:multiple sugar transport system ATP-binding protein
MSEVRLNDVHKHYNDVHAVRGVDLAIADGELVVLVGPSGCGKTTLLRMIAGLEDVDFGTIEIGTRVVNELRPRDRDIAMVFQNYALYPYLSVFENIAFGLRARKTAAAEIADRVRSAAGLLGIDHLLERYPRHLSGGQRQRVAMGRAIVREPDVFLFDEPLSNLDAQLREEVRGEIKALHERLGATMVYVTHDQLEAMTLADRIVLLRNGRVEQVGTPMDLYERPVSRFVASFIGSPPIRFVDAILDRQKDRPVFRIASDTVLPVPADCAEAVKDRAGETFELGIRPEHVHLAGHAHSGAETASVSARVGIVQPTGARIYVKLYLDDEDFEAELPAHVGVHGGDEISLDIDLGRMVIVDPKNGSVIGNEPS